MGLFYTNITLKGPTQEEVVAYLRERERDAYVSPTIAGITVVYDKACEDQNYDVLHMVTADLSHRFGCTALAALLHDGDFLWYVLYQNGQCMDSYNSCPAYFTDDVAEPSGGDAALLCQAFGADKAVQDVDTLLHIAPLTGDIDDENDDDFELPDTYLPAKDIHQAIAHALGWPAYMHSIGYYTVVHGYVPDGADVSRIVKTLP